ncbi:MAG: hypothetical protein A2086_08575 [Spirochaetes bacterium GWD1_27_9]|nr:MAG: hypothetical protein A2Z98_15515 [Spirochaetes bacterium GWB1_27_13]OHD21687.1 MAG: hypothetical protein A2Y34_14050 [Spirochaetes bacterium GWC1_27_15]OHD44439.1 MAG: hypothetical protein A2086_08575 [Spirochaetes bacterium GWD1_27_9]
MRQTMFIKNFSMVKTMKLFIVACVMSLFLLGSIVGCSNPDMVINSNTSVENNNNNSSNTETDQSEKKAFLFPDIPNRLYILPGFMVSNSGTPTASNSFKVFVKVTDGRPMPRIGFEAYTSYCGTDDLKWYEGTVTSSTTCEATISTANHNTETGDYVIKAYSIDANGKTLIGETYVYICKSLAGNIETSPTTAFIGNTFSVRIRNVTYQYSSNNGGTISKVLFPTWTTQYGQDDLIWHEGTRIPGTNDWTVSISTSTHKSENGEYIIHVYSIDSAGNRTPIGGTSLYIYRNKANSIINEGASIAKSSYKVTAKNVINEGGASISRVLFPTWTEANGQDDLIWHEGTRISGTNDWEFRIQRSEHKNEAGKYITHVYAIDGYGNINCIGASETTITKNFTFDSISYNPVENSNILTVKINNVVNTTGVSSVVFPTWSEVYGQNDIRWYQGTRINQKDWQIQINTIDHIGWVEYCNTGNYLTHIYGNGSVYLGEVKTCINGIAGGAVTHTGNQMIAGSTTFKVKIENVIHKGGKRVAKVYFPTWTENNGQDELLWHEGTKSIFNNDWEVTININQHKNERGQYIIHIYSYDEFGNRSLVGLTTVYVSRDGQRVKLPGDNRIFLVDQGKKRFIGNISIYNSLFVNWNGIIETNDINYLPDGVSIVDSNKTYLAKAYNDYIIYLVDNGVKRLIANQSSYNYYNFGWDKFRVVYPGPELDAFNNMPSVNTIIIGN